MKYFIFISLVMVLIGISCSGSKTENIFIFERLSPKQQCDFLSFTDSLSNNNIFIDIIFNEFVRRNIKIKIQINENAEYAGFIPDTVDNGGQIIFISYTQLYNENALIEELFHVFQYHYYTKAFMLPDTAGVIKGAANIEFEAKLFKLIGALYYDNSLAETPSQKGLINYVMKMIEKSGRFPETLNDFQKSEYIKLVHDFREHWQRRNQNENIKNRYDEPVIDTLGPDACLFILQKYNRKISFSK